MSINAVLFDLGNTLVAYYDRAEFHPILWRCLANTAAALGLEVSEAEQAALFEHAKELNREAEDFSVRPLAERLCALFAHHADFETTDVDHRCLSSWTRYLRAPESIPLR